MRELDEVSNLLFGPGSVMSGIDMSLTQARKRVEARGHSPGMKYCIVSNWIWIDLILSDAQREPLHSAGLQPVMLYAHSVMFDSEGRFNPGDWVRTTPLVSFSEDCFFQTRNTLYVLVGEGVRKQAKPSTVMSLF